MSVGSPELEAEASALPVLEQRLFGRLKVAR